MAISLHSQQGFGRPPRRTTATRSSPTRASALWTLGLVLGASACSSPRPSPQEFAAQLPVQRKLTEAENERVRRATDEAMSELQAGNYIPARDHAERALAIEPRAARARAILGRALMGLAFATDPRDLDRAEAAEGHLLMAIKLAPGDLESRLFYAQFLVAEGHLSRAAKELDHVLQDHPQHRLALRTAAEVRYELSEEVAALTLLSRYLTVVPGDAWALYRLANCRLQLGDAHLRKDARTATDKKPAEAAIGEYELAARAFLDYQLAVPADAAGFLGEADARCRALFAAGQGRKDERDNEPAQHILAIFRKARQLDPKAVAAFHGEGVIHDYQGQPELARESYEQALQLEPDFLPSMLNLAALLHASGQEQQAKALWQRTLELDISPQEKRQIRKLLESR